MDAPDLSKLHGKKMLCIWHKIGEKKVRGPPVDGVGLGAGACRKKEAGSSRLMSARTEVLAILAIIAKQINESD